MAVSYPCFSLASILCIAIACGASESDDDAGSASADPSSTADPQTSTDGESGASSSTSPAGDDAGSSETTSTDDDEPASSSSSASDGAATPGSAGTYEACNVDDDCASPDDVCRAVHPLAKPQCRPPCAPDGWCDPDPGVGNFMFGACADDGYCMVYCAEPMVPCVAPYVCARYEGAQDGVCSPP